MKKIKTWAGKSVFSYLGNIKTGTIIYFGTNEKKEVTAKQYQCLLTVFHGKKVPCGTSRDNPPNNSLGLWLQNNITKTAIASYVGAILVEEGYAFRENDKIQFY